MELEVSETIELYVGSKFRDFLSNNTWTCLQVKHFRAKLLALNLSTLFTDRGPVTQISWINMWRVFALFRYQSENLSKLWDRKCHFEDNACEKIFEEMVDNKHSPDEQKVWSIPEKRRASRWPRWRSLCSSRCRRWEIFSPRFWSLLRMSWCSRKRGNGRAQNVALRTAASKSRIQSWGGRGRQRAFASCSAGQSKPRSPSEERGEWWWTQRSQTTQDHWRHPGVFWSSGPGWRGRGCRLGKNQFPAAGHKSCRGLRFHWRTNWLAFRLWPETLRRSQSSWFQICPPGCLRQETGRKSLWSGAPRSTLKQKENFSPVTLTHFLSCNGCSDWIIYFARSAHAAEVQNT